jgi:hypothetical protein
LHQTVTQCLIANGLAGIILKPAVSRRDESGFLYRRRVSFAISVARFSGLAIAHPIDMLWGQPNAGALNGSNIEHHKNCSRCHFPRAV